MQKNKNQEGGQHFFTPLYIYIYIYKYRDVFFFVLDSQDVSDRPDNVSSHIAKQQLRYYRRW